MSCCFPQCPAHSIGSVLTSPPLALHVSVVFECVLRLKLAPLCCKKAQVLCAERKPSRFVPHFFYQARALSCVLWSTVGQTLRPLLQMRGPCGQEGRTERLEGLRKQPAVLAVDSSTKLPLHEEGQSGSGSQNSLYTIFEAAPWPLGKVCVEATSAAGSWQQARKC